ncbi:MAG: glycine cleavage system protein GcvH [Candidatus Omnitrophota bacterium]
MSGLKFTKSHEWVKIEGQTVIVGITDYAQHQLGDIVFIELPQTGVKVQKASQLGTIESTKAASELYAPLSGEVIKVNDQLVNNPQWINESSQDKGWMVKIKIENPTELDSLIDEDTYNKYVEEENH